MSKLCFLIFLDNWLSDQRFVQVFVGRNRVLRDVVSIYLAESADDYLITVEVLVAASEQLGHENLWLYLSRYEAHLHQLIESSVFIRDAFASGFRMVSLGCKDPKKHVQSLR